MGDTPVSISCDLKVGGDGYLPAWLSDYVRRKKVTIDGSSAGAQTDYQMRLNVHQENPPIEGNGKYPLHPTITYPQAYCYNSKTYVVWQGGPNFDPYIDCYDNSAGTWHGAVKLGTNPLTDDTHGCPAVVVDDSGYIHVFFGCHGTALKHSKSTNTEDISTWTAQTDIGTACTYPNVIKDSGGTLYLFVRELDGTTNHEHYRKSTDFSSSTQIIVSDANDTIYHGNVEYDATNDRIHIPWCYYDASETDRLNIYHAYLYIGATNGQTQYNLYSMSGTDLGTSITKAEADTNCKIVDSSTYETNAPALHLDTNKYPYVIYNVDSAGGWGHRFIKWNGSSWDASGAITTSGSQHSYADFIINSTTSLDAYLTVSVDSKESGDLDKWHWNGSSWAKTSTILAKTAAHHDGLNSANIVVNATSALQTIFAEVHVAGYTTTYDLNIYALDSSDVFLAGYGRVGLNGHCQDDFDDIRFTQSDGSTELDHWRETYVSGDDAVFFIEFNSIAASPDSTDFYVYFDKSDGSSGSNGANTFIDFTSWESDVNDWTEDETLGSDATVTKSDVDKYIGTYSARIECPEVSYGGYSKPCSLTAAKQLEFWVRVSTTTQIIVLQDQAAYSTDHMFVYFHFMVDNDIETYNGAAFQDTGADWVADTWYRVKFSNFDFTSYTFDVDIYDTDGVRLGGRTGAGSWQDLASITHINVQDAGTSYVMDVFLDAYRIRNFCDPEPTWGAWGREEPPDATISRVFGRNRTMSPELSLSTTISRVIAATRTVAQGLTAALSITRTYGRLRTVSVGLSAFLTIINRLVNTIVTSCGLVASASLTVTKGFLRSTGANAAITAAISTSRGWTETVVANLNLTAAILRAVSFVRASAPSLTSISSFSIDWSAITDTLITIGTNLSVGASVAYQWAAKRTISPSLALTAAISRTVTKTRSVAVSLTAAVSFLINEAVGRALKVITTVSHGFGMKSVASHAKKIITRESD